MPQPPSTEQLQEHYRAAFGEELGDDDAADLARQLLALYELLDRVPPPAP